MWAVAVLGALPAASQVQFADVASQAGISFQHRNGAQGEKHPPETMGSGAAFFDYDGDGRLDLYFVNSAGPAALYRNEGDGTFAERAAAAGVAESGYGMGCAVADYDNDGNLDLYLTCYGPNILYRNQGNGHFADETVRAGVGDSGLGTGAAFADYDNDGDVDLYVANYVEYRPEMSAQPCVRGKGIRVYCGPEAFSPQPDVLYWNEGDGKFSQVGEEAGLLGKAAKELGAFFSDYDNDGDQDLYAAGDRTPNLLYRNDGGRFAEVGALAGVAYNEAGKPLAGMGVSAADYDNDGLFDFFVTNYQWETNSLYRNLGQGFFADLTFASGLGVPSLARMGWGTAFFDYDNDGDRDLFVANGHLDDNVHLFDQVTYAQQNQLFRNDLGRFAEATDRAGPGLALVQVSRGAVVGDYDEDGDLDLAIANNNQPAALLRNDGGNQQHWLALRLVGSAGVEEGRSAHPPSNRDGIGARVEVRAGDLVQVDEVRSGSSYLCQSDMRLFFGLGQRSTVERVKIRWPSGRVQELADVKADQVLTVREAAGPGDQRADKEASW